jgi:holliday junction DNA helicase RuvA
MISHIFGKAVEKFGSSVIVDVHGIGYEVQVPIGDYDSVQLDEEVKFHTYHYIREQSQELFGFSSLLSKKLFELLITVQGVGPKAALSIMSLGDSESVRSGIAAGDSSFLAKASGVGKKTAERVVVDLSDKVGYAANTKPGIRADFVNDEALEALIALGYNLNDAAKALEGVSTDLTTSQRVTQALRDGM